MEPERPCEQENTPVTPEQPKKKGSLGARAAFAAAFAFIGAKLSYIGLPLDIKNMFSRTKADTLRGRYDELKKQIKEEVANDPTVTNWFERKVAGVKATAKVFKYGAILTGIGVVAGATVGWVRGNRAGDPKNIIHHPVKSVKIVLGLEPPAQQEQEKPMLAKASLKPAHEEQNPANWQDRVGSQPKPEAEALMASR